MSRRKRSIQVTVTDETHARFRLIQQAFRVMHPRVPPWTVTTSFVVDLCIKAFPVEAILKQWYDKHPEKGKTNEPVEATIQRIETNWPEQSESADTGQTSADDRSRDSQTSVRQSQATGRRKRKPDGDRGNEQ